MEKYKIYSVPRSSLQNLDYINYYDIASEEAGFMGCDSLHQLLLMFIDFINSEDKVDDHMFFLADEENKRLLKLE